jgi:predicted aconitase with swiveling domain
MRTLRGEVLVEGLPGEGRALVLAQPISFWGGVDPATARIADVRHPQHGASVAGRVLFLPGTIGSSSASAVLMELVHRGIAPAALVLDHAEAILLLGLIVAREMGWEPPVAVRLAREHFSGLDGEAISVEADGTIRF